MKTTGPWSPVPPPPQTVPSLNFFCLGGKEGEEEEHPDADASLWWLRKPPCLSVLRDKNQTTPLKSNAS